MICDATVKMCESSTCGHYSAPCTVATDCCLNLVCNTYDGACLDCGNPTNGHACYLNGECCTGYHCIGNKCI